MNLGVDLLLGKRFISRNQAKAQLVFNEWNRCENAVILDTETTGLYDAEIVEISVIDLAGNVLFDTLVKPKNGIPEEATAIHGITDEMVADSPTWPEVWDKLYPVIKDKKILIYNAEFDTRMMWESFLPWTEEIGTNRLFEYYEPMIDELDTDCVMKKYADLIGSSRWVKLTVAAGREIAHRALDDCRATLEVIKKSYQPDFTELDYHRALIYLEYRQTSNEINWITGQLERLAAQQRRLLEEQRKYLSLLLDEQQLKEHISNNAAAAEEEEAAQAEAAATTAPPDNPFEDDGQPVDISDDDLPF